MRRPARMLVILLAVVGLTVTSGTSSRAGSQVSSQVSSQAGNQAGNQAGSYPVLRNEVAPSVYIEVLPRAELLAGVLSQTSWVTKRGPKGSGNTYYRALKDHFTPYRNHRAVKLAERLTRRGFSYDAPVAFVAGLDELPGLTATNGFDAQVVERAGSRKVLSDLEHALSDLAGKAQFDQFLTAQAPLLAEMVRNTAAGWDLAGMIEWMREFYGWGADEYHVVLVPAMFPGGGYGVSVHTAAGRLALYMFIRERGVTDGAPEFFLPENAKSGQWLALHEWGHSFVNPSLGKYPERVRRLKPLYDKVAKQMRNMAYSSVETFLNEQVLRAAVVLGVRDLEGEEAARARVQQEERNGFYLTQRTVELLESYRERRNEFPTFEAFVPEILRSYEGLLKP